MRESTGFRPVSKFDKSPARSNHCDLQSVPCKSQKNYVNQSCQQQHESSHSNGKCKTGSRNTLAQRIQTFKDLLRPALTMGTTRARHERKPNPSHRQGSPDRRREAHSARKHRVSCDFKIPQVTCAKQSLRSAIRALQITVELRQPKLPTAT